MGGVGVGVLIIILLFAAICFIPPRSPADADVIFTNATIYTADPGVRWAEAMAVSKGRVLQIGSFSSVQVMVGPKTQHVDLQGKFIVPGFVDSHVHLISGGLQMAQVDLRDACSHDEFIDKVWVFIQGAKSGQWVLGGGWNNEKWGGVLPQASWIDPFTKYIPVWIYRIDGHMGLANSLALQLAGIDENISDPEGGSIMKDKNGGLTGILTDSAMKLVIRRIPEPSTQERRDAFARASRHALSRGVTGLIDFGRFFPGSAATTVWDDFYEVYNWADQTGGMLLRVSVYFPLETWSRMAPYADNPDTYGLEVSNLGSILKDMIEADKLKFQVAVHAIGDAANDRVLTTFQTVMVTSGPRDRRFRIEHAQHLSQKAPELFSSLNVVASMQPEHLLDDANYASKKLGKERSLQQSYLLNSLLKNGTQLAFGSDWPVAHLNPLVGMRAAVKRTPFGWKAPWIPSESIDIEAALRGYTISAAYASFMDGDIGSLSRGKFADFVVLSGELFSNFDDELHVISTYVGGMEAFHEDKV